jgi:cephalosporin hydroxylase
MSNFTTETRLRIEANALNQALIDKAKGFLLESINANYSYNFCFLGRPIIQYPQDIVAFQEIVWHVQPDVIVETGIAHGGSLILSASLLAMLDLCEATINGELLDPATPKRKVIGVDIDIRQHNRVAIEAHPLAKRITMLEGSSVDPAIVEQVRALVGDAKRVLVCLDSNHTHDHVLAELEAYGPMVSRGSYCVVFNTVIEDMPNGRYPNRPWGPGNNVKTAVWEFLKSHPEFAIDKQGENKLQITVAPGGHLKRVG